MPGGVSNPSGPISRPTSATQSRIANAPMSPSGRPDTNRNGQPMIVADRACPRPASGRSRCRPTNPTIAARRSPTPAPRSATALTATPTSMTATAGGTPRWLAGAPRAVSRTNPTVRPTSRPSRPDPMTRPASPMTRGGWGRASSGRGRDTTWTTGLICPSRTHATPARRDRCQGGASPRTVHHGRRFGQSRAGRIRRAEWPGGSRGNRGWRPRQCLSSRHVSQVIRVR